MKNSIIQGKNYVNLVSKGKFMLFNLLLFVTLFSCKKESIQDQMAGSQLTTSNIQSEAAITASLTEPSNLIHNETFEGSTTFPNCTKQFGMSYSFTVATDFAFEGSKSGRIELRDTDPITSGGTRSEVLFPEVTNKSRWYSFSAYYPSDSYAKDTDHDILSQWHQGGGTSPSLTLRAKNDLLYIKVGNSKESREDISLGVMTKDTWHNFVFHIIHSYNGDGLVEVWQNGVKRITHTGGNMYNLSLPRWKVGIYKDGWNDNNTTATNKRIFYLDNIRMGNENATVNDMSSVAGTSSTITQPVVTEPTPVVPEPTPVVPTPTEPTPVTPTTQEPVTFTLVNAATEADIMTIVNGSSISLGSLGLSKLNIRANTNPSAVGSVRFTLSGAQSQTYIDNAFPYALKGDNGNGNYYYGDWNPPATGSYTLQATTYSGFKGSGTAGASTTISFTILK